MPFTFVIVAEPSAYDASVSARFCDHHLDQIGSNPSRLGRRIGLGERQVSIWQNENHFPLPFAAPMKMAGQQVGFPRSAGRPSPVTMIAFSGRKRKILLSP